MERAISITRRRVIAKPGREELELGLYMSFDRRLILELVFSSLKTSKCPTLWSSAFHCEPPHPVT